jgi:hypothetical protein
MKPTSFITLVVEEKGTSGVIILIVSGDVGKHSVTKFKNVVDDEP